MNKLFMVLALLFALSACSVGKKCTYTQEGTKISSWVWFFNGDKPIDLDENNCKLKRKSRPETLLLGYFNSLLPNDLPIKPSLRVKLNTNGGTMETIKQIWKDHRKIVIGAGVVIVVLIIAAL